MAKMFLILLPLLFIAAVIHTADTNYQVNITTVTVWMKALDRSGKPIQGLTQKDFEIKEDGHSVTPSAFEEITLTTVPDLVPASGNAQTAVVETGAPKFVIFLDLYNMLQQQYGSVRPALQEFVDTLATSKREIMLGALLPNGKAGVVIPFTKDFAQIRSTLEKAPTNSKETFSRKRREEEVRAALGSGDIGSAKGGDERLQERIFRGFQKANSFASEEKLASELALHSMETLGAYLRSLNSGAHAVVIYVSGGFSNDPGRHYYDIVDRVADEAQSPDIRNMSSQARSVNFDFKQELQKSIGQLNRTNVTLYTIDASGESQEKDYQESLRQIADETGGLAFSNSQNFKAGLENVIQDVDHQYILSYRTPNHNKPNEYHKIKVECKNKDVKLRYRQGYLD